ncbi:nitrous oxide reductase accessory protein NosL [Leptobacterium sp. I13]|uniref:nitrous oxide reductase accessory protein NosL n=1 Tax=Leptobacterium meishanense TaxID=3128904 RepID=UPI0030EB7E5B
MKKTLILLLLIYSLCACSIQPKEIEYGTDSCHYCEMTIVDKLHAAEIVTNKGKVFKFDATECMINHFHETSDTPVALFLSTNYTQPGELMDATKATFLISEAVPSPMGENLSAFKDEKDVLKLKKDKGGIVLSWEELLNRFERK